MLGQFVARALGVAILAMLIVGTVRAGERRKVVVLGFDGADARLVEQWMNEGELPNLDALRDEGSFHPLQPTNPPQTPVSWSTFATGLNPGKTEIFDFLKRDADHYTPDFAMMSEAKRPFLFGENNPLLLGLIVGASVLLLGLGLSLRGSRRRLIAASALLLAALAGGTTAVGALRYLPVEVPEAVNNRKGETMWELADRAGLATRVIRVPATFPAERLDRGQMLSGLGVPDMRGRVGTPALYTSSRAYAGADNEFSLELLELPARRGVIETRVVGPYNKPFYQYEVERRAKRADPEQRRRVRREAKRELDDAGVDRRIDLPLKLEVTDTTVTIGLSGQSHTLRVGEWSDWFELAFPVNGLIDRVAPLQGTARFKLLQLEPELELYLSPLNFHPDCGAVTLAWPKKFAKELRERFGLFKTLGWALDTWSLPSGVGDEELFLEDMHFTVDRYAEMMRGLLADDGTDLYVQIFYFPDRIAHLFWQHMDPGHPLHDVARAERYRGEMLKAYKRMDALVGEARELAGRDAAFFVCSDHGFSSFRRGVNYNNWLLENGFMVLKQAPGEKATLEKLFDTKDLFTSVDWSKTKAYAMGLGSIYINLAGRERDGIVLPGPEYDEVRQQIKDGLEALVDETTGDRPVTRVWTREEMYTGFREDLIPDLRASNNLNYRVSWQTSLGGFGETLIEDNTKPWSGDHCSNDPSLVPGIFLSNMKINSDKPRMVDMMPTILKVLGVDVPETVDGRPLL